MPLYTDFQLWGDRERDGTGSVSRTKGDSMSAIDAVETRFVKIPPGSIQHGRDGLMKTVLLVVAMSLLLYQIFFRAVIKAFLTAWRTEVVGLAFVI